MLKTLLLLAFSPLLLAHQSGDIHSHGVDGMYMMILLIALVVLSARLYARIKKRN